MSVGNGKVSASVHFTDGSLIQGGSRPAQFTTDDFITQKLIEASPEFKSGRIFILRSVELDEYLSVRRASEKPIPPATAPVSDPPQGDTPEDGTSAPGPEIGPTEGRTPEDDTSAPVAFHSNSEARDFLEEKGLSGLGSKTRAELIAAAESIGIAITFE